MSHTNDGAITQNRDAKDRTSPTITLVKHAERRHDLRVSTIPLTALDVENPEHWRALCPELHLEGQLSRTPFAITNMDELLGQLHAEGYVNVPGVFGDLEFEPLRKCIESLHQSGIPTPFAFVYDEFWHAFQGVSGFVEAALGKDYLALPSFWAWHMIASEESAGLGPHRDRVGPTIASDASPHSLTVWLPFSDATPLNGCIYVLPAQHDDRCRQRAWDGPGNNDEVVALRDIRALPARAGSFLAWDQALLRWDGRASRRAEGPLISAAFEFQRRDMPPFDEPLLDPQRVPSFAERLGLIGKQLLQRRHIHPMAPAAETLATELRDRFMPRVVSALPPAPTVRPDALTAPPSTPRLIDPKLLRESMVRRLFRGAVATGQITLAAVPGMIDEYVAMCDALFAAVGSRFTRKELADLRAVLEGQLAQAYAATSRSTVTISYEAPWGTLLNYHAKAEWKTIGDAYHHWIASREPPLFGTHPDARVWALANEAADPTTHRILDIGGGTGRNALALARRGHPVDVVELTLTFAEMIRADAARDALDVRVFGCDIFSTTADLRQDYGLILLSEVVSDFRTTEQLRRLFRLAAQCLGPTGRLVFNAFLARPEYTPDEAARQVGEQMYTSIFTRSEMSAAAAEVPLRLVADDSVYDYERAHLPEGAWPPTSWYEDWISGLDVFDVERDASPIEMRWLVFQKTE